MVFLRESVKVTPIYLFLFEKAIMAFSIVFSALKLFHNKVLHTLLHEFHRLKQNAKLFITQIKKGFICQDRKGQCLKKPLQIIY